MKKLRVGVCLAAALVLGGLGVAVMAAPGARAGGCLLAANGDAPGPLRWLISGQVGRLMTLRSELQLTPEQRDQIREIVKRHRQEIAMVVKPVVEKKRALREATVAEGGDEKAIRAAADELGKAIGEAAVVGSKIKGEVFKVMTPEQRGKIEDFRREADQAVDEFMGKMASSL